MSGYEAKNPNAYRLTDAKTGLTLLMIPADAYGSPQLALCAAGRQARRHAAGGAWVLLSGVGRSLLYVGEHCFVPCEECGKWMPPRRRGNCCPECRTEAAQAAQAAAAPPAKGKAGKKPRAAGASKRRRAVASPNQLTLPEL